MKIKHILPAILLAGLINSCQYSEQNVVDITNYKCKISSEKSNSPVGEEVAKLIDNDKYSKFLTFSNSAKVLLETPKKCVVNKFTLTSGNDSPERDPGEVILKASSDKQKWVVLDKQSNVSFTKRNETIEFYIQDKGDYKFFSFDFKSLKGDVFQLSEIEMFGGWDKNDNTPIAMFTAENTSFFNKGKVNFFAEEGDNCIYKWTFNGGEPSVSSLKTPVVEYSKPGKYAVKLEVSNGIKSDVIEKSKVVVVKREGGWSDFVYPEINFVNESRKGNGAIFDKLVPDPVPMIKKICLDVSKYLYKSVDEIDVLEKFDYIVKDSKTLAAKGGNPPHIYVFFSSSYIKKIRAEMTDEQIMAEIHGVLYHEITHGYQYSPRGCGGYGDSKDYYSLVEGIADCVRYKAGYFNLDSRKPGGHWTDGYRTTGFFIDWLKLKDKDFLYKLNQSAHTVVPWSWNAATKHILGESTQKLWDEYQKFLKSEDK